MPKYIKGNKIIQATERAYEVIYKSQGFTELKFIEDTNKAHELAIKEELPNKSVEELKEIAKAKGLEGYSKLKKDELISVLVGE